MDNVRVLAVSISIGMVILSCSKPEPDSCTCTTYLNGTEWSKQKLSDCDNCHAPNGYDVTCSCD